MTAIRGVKSTDPELTVVIVAHNSGTVIRETLQSVARFLPDAEVVLVDNESTDDTVGVAREANQTLRLIAGHGNEGFGAGANRGVAAAGGELVLVLNPDAPLVHGSLRELASTRRSAAPFGLIACAVKTRGSVTHLVFRQRRWLREITTFIAWAFLKPREVDYSRRTTSPTDSEAWISGAAFLIARDEFEQVGGFDPVYFLYCEDTDLSRRYKQHGFPLATTDSICVAHDPAGEKSSAPAARVAWTLLSMVEYAAKWEGRIRGRAAAIYVDRWLRLLGLTEPTLGRLPRFGDRVVRSARRASAVRSHLARVCDGSLGPSSAYPFARRAFARGSERDDPGRDAQDIRRHAF